MSTERMSAEKPLEIDTSGAEVMANIFHGRGPIVINYGNERYELFLREGETPEAAAQRIKRQVDAREEIISKSPELADSFGITVDELARVLEVVSRILRRDSKKG